MKTIELDYRERHVDYIFSQESLQKAHLALSMKDEQIQKLEIALKNANQCITQENVEKIAVVEEYESRIRRINEKNDDDCQIRLMKQLEKSKKQLNDSFEKKHNEEILRLKAEANEVIVMIIIRKLKRVREKMGFLKMKLWN